MKEYPSRSFTVADIVPLQRPAMLGRPVGRSTQCERRIGGSEAKCDNVFRVTPDSRRTARAFFEDADQPFVSASVKIKGATAEEQELLLHAWAAMLLNPDVIQWSVCWVKGTNPKRAGASLLKHIRRDGVPRATIKVRAKDGINANLDFTGGVVRIGRRNLTSNLDAWRSSDERDRLCGVLDLAGTLLHEMAHVVSLAGSDSGTVATHCYHSYLIENIFRYGLFSRYEVECCGHIGEATWGFNQSLFLSNCPPT